MNFGLMFFAASEDSLGADKYRLVIDSARFGDREGFSSVWVPERHFTAFGGLYPNPAVLHAGLATCTSRIRLNAGSVVAPLHHPLRIAEEWSVVDNLSNGRVGLSFASGWNPDDFVFAPERYADRQEQMVGAMQTVQQLWRGDAFEGTNGAGQPARVRIFPRPVQRELPVWMTVAGNPRNFERAGSLGAHLLTHLLDQDESVLAERIALYRAARGAAGFDPASGIVSLMIHTFVGSDAATVREQARGPYCNYIKANIGLFKGLAQSRGREADLSRMSAADLDEFTNFLYDRFAASRGLIGTPESCAPLVSRLAAIGVDELACLLDFGPAVDLILGNLPHLARLKALAAPAPAVAIASHGVDRGAVIARCGEAMTGEAFHRALAAHGIQISGAFQPAASIWRRDGEAIAELQLPGARPGYGVNPEALDACGRMLAAALPGFGNASTSYLPSGFEACDVVAPLTGRVWVHARVNGIDDRSGTVAGDVDVSDDSGRPIARIAGLTLAPVEHRAATPDTADLLYERTWVRTDAAPGVQGSVDASGTWLIVADHAGVGAALAREIGAHGGTCVDAPDTGLRGIIYLRGLDATIDGNAPPEAFDGAARTALEGALRAAQTAGDAPIWIVTRGAVEAAGVHDLAALPQAALWGFGRGIAVERPGGLGALVDLDPGDAAVSHEETARLMLREITSARTEDMVAFRGGARYVPRLTRTAAPASDGPVFTPDDTVLITGGTGGLGLRVADWAASRGARHIVMVSRRPPAGPAAAALQRLRDAGVELFTPLADVADFDALSRAVDIGRPITSIFHLAGVLDDGVVEEQTWERFDAVLAAKARGAWNLHLLTRRTAVKHFVMFSSISSMLPAPGQSTYAAANAVLDALARSRRAIGLDALAVSWGPWAEAGHAETDYGRQAHARLARMGIGAIAPAAGLRVMEQLMARGSAHAAAVMVDWPALAKADPAAARLPFLSAVLESATRATPPEAASSALVQTLEALPREERRPYLLQYLSDMVSAALRLGTDTPIDARQPLFDAGLDSIMALEVKDRLERALGVPLSATLLFVRPTLDALAEYILTDIVRDAAPVTAGAAGLSEDDLTRLLLQEIDASRGA